MKPASRFATAVEEDTEKHSSPTVTTVRRLALIGVLTGLAAVIPYAESIPWLELQTLVVFAAGFLLGARSGAWIGALAMAFYSLANPQGLVHPVVFLSQVLGRAVVGAMGGWAFALGLPAAVAWRAVVLALWAMATALAFDVPTNLAAGLVYGQMIPMLVGGIPFALGHLGSNIGFFIVVGIPLFSALTARRAQWVGGAAFFLALVASGSSSAMAQGAWLQTGIPRDSLTRGASDSSSVARADSVGVAPADSSAGVALDSLRVPLERARRSRPGDPQWALQVGPRDIWRFAPTDSDDILALLGAGPRFYGDVESVEPLRFSAFPGGFEGGHRDGLPLWTRSTPWQSPTRVSSGARAGWAW